MKITMITKNQLDDLHFKSWKENIFKSFQSHQCALSFASSPRQIDYLLGNEATLLSHEGVCLVKITIENDPKLFGFILQKGQINLIDKYYEYTGKQLFNNLEKNKSKVHKYLSKIDIDFSRYNTKNKDKSVNCLVYEVIHNPENAIHLLSHPKCFAYNKRQKDKIITLMLDTLIEKRQPQNKPLGKKTVNLLSCMLDKSNNKLDFLDKLSSSNLKGFSIKHYPDKVLIKHLPQSKNINKNNFSADSIFKKHNPTVDDIENLLSTNPPKNKDLHLLFLRCVNLGHVKSSHLLLDYGINPDFSHSINNLPPRSAVFICAAYSYPSLMKTILSFNANPNWTEKDGAKISALASAVMSGNKECVKILLDNGANPNILDENKKSPLFHLPLKTSPETCLSIAHMLLQAGANPSLKDKNGKSVFDFLSLSLNEQTYIITYKDSLLMSLKALFQTYQSKNEKDALFVAISPNQKRDERDKKRKEF